MKILLRFDDICPAMDWEQWERAAEEMDRCGVKPLIGVIPDCQDPVLQIRESRADFWEYILKLQKHGYTVAMHGYQHLLTHTGNAMVAKRKDTEFAGLSYEEQYRKIAEGKKILNSHGIFTDVFIAPAHSYDAATLKALYDNDFRFLSDGQSMRPYVQNGIYCIPTKLFNPGKMKTNQNYTAVFHAHEWIRPEKRDGWDMFIDMCRNHREDLVEFLDMATEKPGNIFVQKCLEKGYLIYLWYIRPQLSRVKRCIRRVLSGN